MSGNQHPFAAAPWLSVASALVVFGCASLTPVNPSWPYEADAFSTLPVIEALRSDRDYLNISGWRFDEPLALAPVLEKRRQEIGLSRTPENDLGLLLWGIAQPTTKDRDDESVWCQHFTLIRLIRKTAHARGIAIPDAPLCPAFERWADEDHLASVEVLMATPSIREPVSSFGHTLIRARYEGRGRVEADDPVYEIVALTDPHDSAINYVWRGFFGGYPLVFEPKQFRDVSLSNQVLQQRDLLRFTLTLTRDERRAVMQRLWELERRAYLPYQFVRRNCAFYLLWLLETALFDLREVPEPDRFIVSPGEVVDLLAEHSLVSRSEPRLNARKEIESWRDEQSAVWTKLARTESLAETLASQGGLTRLVNYLNSSDDRSQITHVRRIILLEMRVRRRQLELLQQREKIAEESYLVRHHLDRLPDLGEVLEARRQYYLDEDVDRRAKLIQERHERVDSLIQLARQNLWEKFSKDLPADVQHAQQRFLEATRAYALVRLDPSPAQPCSSMVCPPQTHEAEEQTSAPPSWTHIHSGFRYTSISGALAISRDSSPSPRLELRRALWREELGDLRAHGLGPTRSLKLLDSRLLVELAAEWPRILGGSTTVFDFSSFELPFGNKHAEAVTFDKDQFLLGWRVMSDLVIAQDVKHLGVLVSAGIISFNPYRSRWQLQTMLELQTRISNRPWTSGGGEMLAQHHLVRGEGTSETLSDVPAFGLAGAAMGSLGYRLGKTGRIELGGRYVQDVWHGHAPNDMRLLRTYMELAFPVSSNEAVRLNATIDYSCIRRCGFGAALGMGW